MSNIKELQEQTQVITAARFEIEFPIIQKMAFSELGGINSKVAPSEYIFSNDKGETVHTKQFGKAEPPTVTLKRALDKEGNAELFTWHNMARDGKHKARQSGFLNIGDADPKSTRLVKYRIEGAWIQEITVAGLKAGDTSAATIEIKLACTTIEAVDSKPGF